MKKKSRTISLKKKLREPKRPRGKEGVPVEEKELRSLRLLQRKMTMRIVKSRTKMRKKKRLSI